MTSSSLAERPSHVRIASPRPGSRGPGRGARPGGPSRGGSWRSRRAPGRGRPGTRRPGPGSTCRPPTSRTSRGTSTRRRSRSAGTTRRGAVPPCARTAARAPARGRRAPGRRRAPAVRGARRRSAAGASPGTGGRPGDRRGRRRSPSTGRPRVPAPRDNLAVSLQWRRGQQATAQVSRPPPLGPRPADRGRAGARRGAPAGGGGAPEAGAAGRLGRDATRRARAPDPGSELDAAAEAGPDLPRLLVRARPLRHPPLGDDHPGAALQALLLTAVLVPAMYLSDRMAYRIAMRRKAKGADAPAGKRS